MTDLTPITEEVKDKVKTEVAKEVVQVKSLANEDTKKTSLPKGALVDYEVLEEPIRKKFKKHKHIYRHNCFCGGGGCDCPLLEFVDGIYSGRKIPRHMFEYGRTYIIVDGFWIPSIPFGEGDRVLEIRRRCAMGDCPFNLPSDNDIYPLDYNDIIPRRDRPVPVYDPQPSSQSVGSDSSVDNDVSTPKDHHKNNKGHKSGTCSSSKKDMMKTIWITVGVSVGIIVVALLIALLVSIKQPQEVRVISNQ